MYAFSDLGTLVFPGYFSVIRSLAPPVLIALGGAIEGLFAETIFDQKIHAFAVILFTPFNLYYEVNRRFIYHNSAEGRITVYKR